MAPLRYAAKFDPLLILDCPPPHTHTLHPGAIQGKEGIKFCYLATLGRRGRDRGEQGTGKGVPCRRSEREQGGMRETRLNWHGAHSSEGRDRETDRHRDGQLPNRVNAIADSTMETERGDREREGGGRSVFPPSLFLLC